jgi:NADPH:quinone reductase-like Zn-dependent oxidoreductase
MLAAQYTENSSDFSTIKLVEVAKPTAEPGLAVVQVKTAAVNPIDIKVMAGALVGAGWAMPLPFSLGYDFSGVIADLHADDAAGAFKVGDAVFAVNWGQHKHDEEGLPTGGAFAQYIKIPVKKLSKKPESLSHDEAAAIALVGTTAHQILFDCAQVKEGSRILVLGGSTGVGAIAIQLAKAKGAWVATTCSTRTADYVSQWKPDLVVNYSKEKWDELDTLKGLDAVIDCVGEADGFARMKAGKVVRDDGSFVTIASFDAGFDPKAHTPLAFASFHCLANKPAVQDELAAMLVEKKLKVVVEKEYPFTEAGVRDMMAAQIGGKAMGKLVLRVDAN